MNGEIYLSSCLCVAAKFALRTQDEMRFYLPHYIRKLEFTFLKDCFGSTFVAKNENEWLENLLNSGLKNIHFSMSLDVKDRSLLGFIGARKNAIVCEYENGVSYFVPTWKFRQDCWDIDYKEIKCKEPTPTKIYFSKDEFSKILLEISALASKIEFENFAKIFASAERVLQDEKQSSDKNLLCLPKPNLQAFMAASKADVFGAMGSWNDSPPYYAQIHGLQNEYERLSNELLRQISLAILFGVNSW